MALVFSYSISVLFKGFLGGKLAMVHYHSDESGRCIQQNNYSNSKIIILPLLPWSATKEESISCNFYKLEKIPLYIWGSQFYPWCLLVPYNPRFETGIGIFSKCIFIK